jgi:hypothetical protein
MSNVPSAEELDASFQAFKDVVTHPEFQKAFEEVQSLPEDQRLDAASTQLTVQALAARGIPIPPEAGISIYNIGKSGESIVSPVEDRTTPAGITDVSPRSFRACIWLFGVPVCVDLPIPFLSDQLPAE